MSRLFDFLKSLSWPSWITSTTSLGFIIVVIGAVRYASVHNDATLIVKLVDMIVPAFVGVKGYQMGKQTNGEAKPDAQDPAKSP